VVADRRAGDVKAGAASAAPNARLSGRVVHAGAPIAGAVIRAWRRHPGAHRVDGVFTPPAIFETTTREHGEFDLELPSGAFMLSAEHAAHGLMTARTTYVDLAGHPTIAGVDLVVDPAAVLDGVLLDADRQPVPGHRVGSHFGGFEEATKIAGVTLGYDELHETTTDAAGRFEIRCVRDHQHLWEVQHPRHPMWRGRHAPKDGRLEIVLERGAAVRGIVFLAGGRPAAGAAVEVHDHPRRRLHTDAQGRFEVVGLDPQGHTYLTVFEAQSAIYVMQPLPAARDDIRVQLEPALALGGQIADTAGNALAGARVAILGERRFNPGYQFDGTPTWEWEHDRDQATADAEGRFLISNLYPGRFRITVQDPDDPRLSVVTEASAGNVALAITFDRTAARKAVARGRVMAAETRSPITRFQVGAQPAGRNSWRWAEVEDPEGRYELVGLDPGPTTLHFAAPGHARTDLETMLVLGEQEHDVSLAATIDVVVRVVDRAGAAVKAHLGLFQAQGQPVNIGLNPTMTTHAAQIHGKTRLLGLLRAVLTARVQVEGRDGVQEQTLDLRQPRDEVELVVDGPGAEVLLDLVVLGHNKDADLSAFAGKPDRAWIDILKQRRDVWLIDTSYRAILTTAMGQELSQLDVTRLADGDTGPSYQWKLRHGNQGNEGPLPVATAVWPLHGRKTAMTLRVEAEGYAPFERNIPGDDLEAERTTIAAFLVRNR